MPGQGYNSWASVAPELVAYGTKSASTYHYFSFANESIKAERENTIQKSLRMGTIGGLQRFTYQNVKKVGGDITMEMNYQGMMQFLKHALGTYTFVADTPVAGANTHTFTLGNTLPNYGLTMELLRANIPSSKVFLYLGGRINQLAINFNTGEIMTLVASMVFKDEQTDQTPSATPTYASDYPVLWRYAGSLILCGETAVPFSGGSLKLNNNLTTDRYLMSHLLPSPQFAGLRELTGEIVGEYDSLALYTKYMAQTRGRVDLTFTSDSLITGTTYRSMRILVENAILEAGTPNVDDPGIVPYTLPWRAIYDGTLNPLVITIVNSEATLT